MGGPYLTMAEIEAKYPNEWVLIDRPTTTGHQELLGGHVIYHGPDKAALYERVKQLPIPYDIATWFTGPPCDEGEEVLLNVGLPR